MEGLCARCGVHPAAKIVADSALDYIHGHWESMCNCCVAWETLQNFREHAAQIPRLEAELAGACDGTGQPPPEIPFGWEGWEGSSAVFWDEDIDAVINWVKSAPNRACGGRVRRPASYTGPHVAS